MWMIPEVLMILFLSGLAIAIVALYRTYNDPVIRDELYEKAWPLRGFQVLIYVCSWWVSSP